MTAAEGYDEILRKLQQYATGPIYYREREQRARAAQKAKNELDALLLTIQAEAWDSGYQDGALYGIGPLAIENPYTKEEQQ